MSDIVAFHYNVSESELSGLRARIRQTRFPDQPAEQRAWNTGSDLLYMQQLAQYWSETFDWRQQEARLNAFRQYTVEMDGINLHFVHEPAERPEAPMLLLCHGWPGSVYEFLDVIPRLTHPSKYGGKAEHAVTVVAPSLPGYGLSYRPGQKRFGISAIADCLARLMTEKLGVSRFFVQGGDWGAFVAARIAMFHAASVIGVHVNLLPVRRDPTYFKVETEAEKQFVQEMDHWRHHDMGYIWIQGTRPQTLAYGLTDSPVGLAAWMVEKFRAWTDCGGDLESALQRDHILAMISFYWFTGAIGSSFWPYYERLNGEWPFPESSRIEVPAAYSQFPAEPLRPPRSIAETLFADIRQWTEMPKGGHFGALEQPQLFAEDVIAFIEKLGR